jgi:hypothetical protein
MMRGKWLLVAVVAAGAGCQQPFAGDEAALDSATTATTTAGVDLVAVGSLPGAVGDRAPQTAGVLENGVAGDLLGGLGSGLSGST